MIELTQAQARNNLELLADYLMTLPEGYEHFDMATYNEDEVGAINNSSHCGTSACALGHAPYVKGLPAVEEDPIIEDHPDFDTYCEVVFNIHTDSDEWAWLFSQDWDDVDNTPKGAAKRIYWMLEHGLPPTWNWQLNGGAELCYQ